MKKKKKVNLPLVEVLVGSLLLHIVAGVIFGSIVLYQAIQQPEPEFVPPPEIKRVQPERLEYKVKMKQQQKQSAKPRMKRIQVESPTNISVPQIDIVAPSVSSEVAVGTGMGGGSGTGNGLGAGGSLGMGKVAVNFFGIKNAGEKIFFLVDASKYMLEDHKGGYPAYEIVKAEIAHLVSKLPAGIMFNVAIYSDNGISIFNAKSMTAKQANSQKDVYDWIAPINQYASSAGNVSGSSTVEFTGYAPMEGKASHWVRALITIMHQKPDTIFWIDGAFKWHSMQFAAEEKKKWLAAQGWDEKRMAKYYENEQKAHEWLAKENEERRSNGTPERIVHHIYVIVQEMGNEIPPDPHFSDAEILETIKNAQVEIYKKNKLPNPSINLVYFKGPEEEDKSQAGRFKFIVRKAGRGGKFKELNGMDALQNVTSSRPETEVADSSL